MVALRSTLEKNLTKYYFSVSILSRVGDMSYIYVTNSTFDQNLWRKRDLTESIELWGTFDVRLSNTGNFLSTTRSATKIVILYKDSYYCVTEIGIVAVLVSIHCLTNNDIKKSRKIGPAGWKVPGYSGKA